MQKFRTSLLALAFVGPALAETHIVNNNIALPADFRSFQEAHDAAEAGDTIVLMPSGRLYPQDSGTNFITINKRLIVRGGRGLSGIGLTEVNQLVVGSGAEGSVFEGIYFKGFLTLGAANVTVRRSWLGGTLSIQQDSCSIDSCYLFQNFSHRSANTMESHPVGTVIQNCYLRYSTSSGLVNNGSLNINHCVFFITNTVNPVNVLSFVTGLVSDSIVDFGTANFSSPLVFNDCLYLNGTQTREINADSATSEETFVLFSEAPEGFPPFEFTRQFELKSTSPARTGASDGGQQGMFGGESPFVHGFHPAVPRITAFKKLSANATNGITFRVEASSQE